jgi:hypothetical protein
MAEYIAQRLNLEHEIRQPGRAPSNCGAIATLSRFLHSATLQGGLLGRMSNAFQ